MKRIPSLDGLRAISISLVVVGLKGVAISSDVAGAFANLGVRIFFIISGYLDYYVAVEGAGEYLHD